MTPGTTSLWENRHRDKIHQERLLRNLHQPSFLALFPCKKPKVVLYLVFDEPKGENIHGGQLAAPVVREFIEATKEYIHRKKSVRIKPMKPLQFTLQTGKNIMPNFIGQGKKKSVDHCFKAILGIILTGFRVCGGSRASPESPLNRLTSFRFSFPQK